MKSTHTLYEMKPVATLSTELISDKFQVIYSYEGETVTRFFNAEELYYFLKDEAVMYDTPAPADPKPPAFVVHNGAFGFV